MPPFLAHFPPPRVPVLLSVPHAGNAYSPALIAAARVPVAALRMLEDPLVDRLIAGGMAAGASAIVAQVPRAEIDLNRSPDDLDHGMIAGAWPGTRSRRAAAGLGLIPSRLAGHGAIWRRPLAWAEVERRIAAVHGPYHDAIAAELARIRDAFGAAVLLDCHSMPPRTGTAPPVVIGDRHGTSAGATLVDAAVAACGARGYGVARNDPYAGGEIVARHGRPGEGIHALQIEIDRSAYLGPDGRSPGPGFADVSDLIASIVHALADAALPCPLSLAAE